MIKVLLVLPIFLLILNARENPFFATKGEQGITYSSNENRTKQPLKRAAISLPSQARILKKVTVEYKTLNGSIEKRTITLDNTVDWHLPIFVSQSFSREQKNEKSIKKVKTKKLKYKKIASIKEVSFFSSGKSLKIISKDKVLRNFLLVNPHRLVIDFNRDSSMKSYTQKISKSRFKQIKIGNHDKYYRAVIELDGHYRYQLENLSNGYLLKLI